MPLPSADLYKDVHDGAKPDLRGIRLTSLSDYLWGYEKWMEEEKI